MMLKTVLRENMKNKKSDGLKVKLWGSRVVSL